MKKGNPGFLSNLPFSHLTDTKPVQPKQEGSKGNLGFLSLNELNNFSNFFFLWLYNWLSLYFRLII